MPTEIRIDRFEIARSRSDGDVMVCFIGPHKLPDETDARFEGDDLVVERGEQPGLRFVGVAPEPRAAMFAARNVYVNRTFVPGDDYRSRVRLAPLT